MGQAIGDTKQTMRADAKAVTGGQTDLTPLLGTWVNAMPGTDHVAKVVVRERNGALLVRPLGSSADRLIDWGEREATPYSFTGTAEVGGFHATYELGEVETKIAANEKQGILVIQSYTSFHDGSGRLSQYGREFFHKEATELGPEGAAGIRFLVGDWENSLPTTEWIKGFTLVDNGVSMMLRIRAASEPTDWGETEVVPCLDNGGSPAFHAVYNLESFEASLAANVGKGLIIVAAFFRFKDDDRPDAFCREFYYRKG